MAREALSKLRWQRLTTTLFFMVCLHTLGYVDSRPHPILITDSYSSTDNSISDSPQDPLPWPIDGLQTNKELQNCSLATTNSSYDNIREIVSKTPALVYTKLEFLTLEFDSDTAYLNETPSIIDPLTWTWASKGKGYLLRGMPPNFLYLSFGTLQPDVYHTTLELSTEFCDDFLKASDDAKIRVLSQFIIDIYLAAYDDIVDTHEEFNVCQDFFSNISTTLATFLSCLLNMHVFLYLPSTTKVICWSSVNYAILPNTMSSSVALKFIYYFVIVCGIVFFPLLIYFTIRNRPPRKDDKKTYYLDKYTNLPVGLKFVLLFWQDKHKSVFFVRELLALTTFFLLSYVEALILKLSDPSQQIRWQSAYRYIINYYFYIAYDLFMYVFLTIAVVVVTLGVYGGDMDLETNHERQNIFMCVKLTSHSNIPEANSSWRWQKKVFHYMKFRVMMAVDRQIIWDDRFWGKCWAEIVNNLHPRKVKDRFNNTHCHELIGPMIVIIYIIILPILPIVLVCMIILTFVWVLLILLVYNPTAYMLIMSIKAGKKPLEDFVYVVTNLIRLSICFGTMTLILVFCIIVLPILVLIRSMSGILTLFANVINYTFTGVTLNLTKINPFLFLLVAMLSYIVRSISDFYIKYYQLNQVIISKAIEINDEIKAKKSDKVKLAVADHTQRGRTTYPIPDQNIDMIDESSELPNVPQTSYETVSVVSFSDIHQIEEQQKHSQVTHHRQSSENAYIREDLFWHVVNNCLPVRVEVTAEILKFILILLLAFTVFGILREVNLLQQLSDVSTLIFSLSLTFVIPMAKTVMKSSADDEVQQALLERHVEATIEKYQKNNYTETLIYYFEDVEIASL